MYAASGNGGLHTFMMDINNWAGVKKLSRYHTDKTIDCMIAIPDGRVLAAM